MHIVAQMPRSVRMQDVAAALNLSRSTVSRALRNDPRLPPATCLRVQECAAKLGYVPHPLVATLMSELKRQRPALLRQTLAFVTAFPSRDGWRRSNPTFLEYFEGAKARAAEHGYQLEEFWLKEPAMNAKRFSKILHTRNISGLVIPPLPRALGHFSLEWEQFSAVAIGYTLRRPELSRAVSNFYQGIRLTLRQLTRLGYHRIGFISDPHTEERVFQAWLAGYLVQQHSLPKRQQIPPFLEQDFTNLKPWIQKHRPDAIIGATQAVYTALQKSGLRAPKDFAFASLNTTNKQDAPAGIAQQAKLVGTAAVDILIGQLQRNERGIPETPMLTLVPGLWIPGATLGNQTA